MTSTQTSRFRTGRFAGVAAAAVIALIGLLAWSGADAAAVGVAETPAGIAAAAFGPSIAPDLPVTQDQRCQSVSTTKRSLGQRTVVEGVTYELYEYTRTQTCTHAQSGTVRFRQWEVVT